MKTYRFPTYLRPDGRGFNYEIMMRVPATKRLDQLIRLQAMTGGDPLIRSEIDRVRLLLLLEGDETSHEPSP